MLDISSNGLLRLITLTISIDKVHRTVQLDALRPLFAKTKTLDSTCKCGAQQQSTLTRHGRGATTKRMLIFYRRPGF